MSASLTEAEYRAMGPVIRTILWIKEVVNEIGINLITPILFVDNESALRLAHHPKQDKNMRHLNVQEYFTRDRVVNGNIKVEWIGIHDQIADIMTKALGYTLFSKHRKALGVTVKENSKVFSNSGRVLDVMRLDVRGT